MANAVAAATQVGRNIRLLRESTGRTLADLAGDAGLSKTTLHGIEQGEANPTLSTLWSLATALEVPLGRLLDRTSQAMTVVRADQGAHVSGDAVHARLLHRIHARGWVELYELDIDTAAQLSQPHLAGVEECMIVTAGRVETGPVETPQQLEAGDSIHFDAAQPHLYRGYDDNNRAILLMLHN